MEANQLSTEHTLKVLLRNRYHRADVELSDPIRLDDCSSLDVLIEAADAMDLKRTEEFLVATFLGKIM